LRSAAGDGDGCTDSRKWVETEPVQTQVKAHRESARIEYEPVGLPLSGVELGEQEIDIPLLVQEPMLEKQVVAKERVRLSKAVEAGHEQVSDEVREERIDVDEETFER
jgi:stress response protein YsnF